MYITREQFAAILYRCAAAMGFDVGSKADLGAFADSALVSDYAEEAVQWAVGRGIIEGVGDALLDPRGNATRAQLAVMITRFNKLANSIV